MTDRELLSDLALCDNDWQVQDCVISVMAESDDSDPDYVSARRLRITPDDARMWILFLLEGEP